MPPIGPAAPAPQLPGKGPALGAAAATSLGARVPPPVRGPVTRAGNENPEARRGAGPFAGVPLRPHSPRRSLGRGCGAAGGVGRPHGAHPPARRGAPGPRLRQNPETAGAGNRLSRQRADAPASSVGSDATAAAGGGGAC